MMSANGAEADWFARHKNSVLTYNSGERLADIDEQGYGRLFYRNGAVAVDYYKAQEPNANKRYVIYSSTESTDICNNRPVAVLGMFDFSGNGVVFDQSGHVRLKYNQNEGTIIDPSIGPPAHWKWHCLNDPLHYKTAYMDIMDAIPSTRNPETDELILNAQTHSATADKENLVSPSIIAKNQMLDIEHKNWERYTQQKIQNHTKYKQFPRKPIYFKINDQMSFRIVDQKNIKLIFRDGSIRILINLGLKLIETEIVDTETTDLSEIQTPLDRPVLRSESLENIKKILDRAKRKGKSKRHSALDVGLMR